MNNKNYILIIGAGKIGSIRANVIKKLSPKSKIYIFDINSDASKKLAKEVDGIVVRSLEKGLKQTNISIVAVINKNAKNICIKALKNKNHVLCEKPMGRNYKEALSISKAVKKYKRVFKCGFNHRYHPGILEAYKLCRLKKIGNLLYIKATYGHGGRVGYDKEWRAKKHLSGGGELLDQGSHLIDLCNWFFDFEQIKKTFCIAKTMFWKMNVDDNAFAIFETNKGKVAQIHVSWTQWKNLFKFEIFGTKGNIEINGLGKSYGIETLKLSIKEKTGAPPRIYEKQYKNSDNSWEKEWKDFTDAIKNNSQPMSNHKESLEVMKTISKFYGE